MNNLVPVLSDENFKKTVFQFPPLSTCMKGFLPLSPCCRQWRKYVELFMRQIQGYSFKTADHGGLGTKHGGTVILKLQTIVA